MEREGGHWETWPWRLEGRIRGAERDLVFLCLSCRWEVVVFLVYLVCWDWVEDLCLATDGGRGG
jgi:hypothetical protein